MAGPIIYGIVENRTELGIRANAAIERIHHASETCFVNVCSAAQDS